VVKGAHTNRSQEEVLDQAARIVAETINANAMGITPEQVDVEHFIQYFKEAATQMLYSKEALYIAIGPYTNTDFSGVYSYDMQEILESIQYHMHTKFYFYYGVALWLCKNDLYAVWLPH